MILRPRASSPHRPARLGRRGRAPGTLALALLLTTSALAGCQLGGFALDTLPKPDVPAVYDPPNRKTLVLIDDPSEQLPTSPLRDAIAERIARQLMRSGTIHSFVPSPDVHAARRSHEDFDRWPVSRVGQHFGAEQVIHVTMEHFRLGESPELLRPTAAAHVKLVDAETGRRLFPEGAADGHLLRVRMFYRDTSRHTVADSGELRRRLAEMLGTDVAKLFYKHPPRRVGSGWQD